MHRSITSKPDAPQLAAGYLTISYYSAPSAEADIFEVNACIHTEKMAALAKVVTIGTTPTPRKNGFPQFLS